MNQRSGSLLLLCLICLFAFLSPPLLADTEHFTITPVVLASTSGAGPPPTLNVTYDTDTQKFSGFAFTYDGVGFDVQGGDALYNVLVAALDPTQEVITYNLWISTWHPEYPDWYQFRITGQTYQNYLHHAGWVNYGTCEFDGVSGWGTVPVNGDHGLLDVTRTPVPEPGAWLLLFAMLGTSGMVYSLRPRRS